MALAQKIMQLSSRSSRLTSSQRLTTSILGRAPQVILSQHIFRSTQIRLLETTASSSSTSPSENAATSALVRQRLNRPVSPHLGIYQPQVTWILSITNRLTGAILSGGLYIFGAAYLVAPWVGWHLESASLVAAVAAWPLAAKLGLKLLLALPFTFHSFNGIRHLVWDLGWSFTNKQVLVTGWTVVGISVVSALGLLYL